MMQASSHGEHDPRAHRLFPLAERETHAGLDPHRVLQVECHPGALAQLGDNTRYFDGTRNVRRAEEELRLITGLERRMTTSLVGGEDVQLGLAIRVRLYRAGDRHD